MQTRRLPLVPSLALAVMLTLLGVRMLVFAQDVSAQAANLEGSWLVDLTPSDCQTGDPIGEAAQFL